MPFDERISRLPKCMEDAALDGKPSVRPHGEPPEPHALQLR